MALTRAQILKAKDYKSEEIQVPEWGDSVFVRSMSGTQRDAFIGYCHDHKDDNDDSATAMLLSLTLCDEDGALLFSQDDIDALNDKDANVLARLAKDAMRINVLQPAGVEAAAENSSASPNA